ncbi:MAG: glycosyltransferase [Bacteroidales bacterium]|nr:glycosyltransferase [Bacteroidales bacterium]
MRLIKTVKSLIKRLLIDHCPQLIIEHEWPGVTGHKIDWNNPKDLNEKIQWLTCFSDTTEWSRLTDKLLVRDYLREKGFESLLPKLYGYWENADSINVEELPEKFVLKCNHDSGSTIIVDKSKGFDWLSIKSFLNQKLNRKFGYVGCEPHYNRIKPLIIAEEYLEPSAREIAISSSIVDYKVWCFNGEPFCTWTCHNRTNECAEVNVYDMDWRVHPECSVFNDHYRDGKGVIPKPESFGNMMKAASILSEGFPQVRVDFYEVGGKLYFGEMTFTSLAGRMDFYTEAFLKEMGDKVVLPNKKCK